MEPFQSQPQPYQTRSSKHRVQPEIKLLLQLSNTDTESVGARRDRLRHNRASERLFLFFSGTEKTVSFYPFRSHLQLQESCPLTKPPPPQPRAPRKARDGSDPTAGARSIGRNARSARDRSAQTRREACVRAVRAIAAQPATTTHGGRRYRRTRQEEARSRAGAGRDQARRRTLAIYL